MTDVMTSDADQASESERTTLLVCYILNALGIFTGITTIVAVVISHIKVTETTNEFIRSHHRWLIKTFWYSVVGGLISFVLTFILVGLLGFVIVGIWWIYRIVRGVLRFSDRQPMPDTLI